MWCSCVPQRIFAVHKLSSAIIRLQQWSSQSFLEVCHSVFDPESQSCYRKWVPGTCINVCFCNCVQCFKSFAHDALANRPILILLIHVQVWPCHWKSDGDPGSLPLPPHPPPPPGTAPESLLILKVLFMSLAGSQCLWKSTAALKICHYTSGSLAIVMELTGSQCP